MWREAMGWKEKSWKDITSTPSPSIINLGWKERQTDRNKFILTVYRNSNCNSKKKCHRLLQISGSDMPQGFREIDLSTNVWRFFWNSAFDFVHDLCSLPFLISSPLSRCSGHRAITFNSLISQHKFPLMVEGVSIRTRLAQAATSNAIYLFSEDNNSAEVCYAPKTWYCSLLWRSLV